MGKQNDLDYLNCEDIIYEYYKPVLEKYGKKAIIVVDLTNFPMVSTRIDIRDQSFNKKVDEMDDFERDVANYYTNYDMDKEALFIMVNLQINHTGLVLHKIKE